MDRTVAVEQGDSIETDRRELGLVPRVVLINIVNFGYIGFGFSLWKSEILAKQSPHEKDSRGEHLFHHISPLQFFVPPTTGAALFYATFSIPISG